MDKAIKDSTETPELLVVEVDPFTAPKTVDDTMVLEIDVNSLLKNAPAPPKLPTFKKNAFRKLPKGQAQQRGHVVVPLKNSQGNLEIYYPPSVTFMGLQPANQVTLSGSKFGCSKMPPPPSSLFNKSSKLQGTRKADMSKISSLREDDVSIAPYSGSTPEYPAWLQTKKFKCKFCGISFEYSETLKLHLKCHGA